MCKLVSITVPHYRTGKSGNGYQGATTLRSRYTTLPATFQLLHTPTLQRDSAASGYQGILPPYGTGSLPATLELLHTTALQRHCNARVQRVPTKSGSTRILGSSLLRLAVRDCSIGSPLGCDWFIAARLLPVDTRLATWSYIYTHTHIYI